MKTSASRLLLLLLLPPATLPLLSAADDDHVDAYLLRQQGRIMPLAELLNTVEQELPGRVIGVELEREDGGLVYEIELLDKEGRVIELLFDATSGRLLGEE